MTFVDTWHLVAIACAGVFAGAVNTIAGGGSLIGLPVLIFAGIPAPMANATNRVGVVLQSATAAVHFGRAGVLEGRVAARVIVPTGIGAIAGSLLSVDIDEALFEKIIGVAMLIMLVVLLLGPRRWLEGVNEGEGAAHERASTGSPWRFLGFLCVGLYGGFLQAGVGIFLLIALVGFAGQDLVRANGTKALLVGLFTLPALGVYVYHDLVLWIPGLALALGSMVGAWLGARMTVSWGPGFVRWVLVVVICGASSRLLGLW